MTSLTVESLSKQIALAISGNRGLNAPIFPDGLVRIFLSSSLFFFFFFRYYSIISSIFPFYFCKPHSTFFFLLFHPTFFLILFQATFYEKIATHYSGGSKGDDTSARLAEHRERAFEDCKKGKKMDSPNSQDVNSNHISTANFAKILQELFPERADSLSRILKAYTDSQQNGAASKTSASGSSKETEKDTELSAEQMDRFSRQIGAYGLAMMKQLLKMDILIVGLQGVGCESAKNIVLAGPKSVTLFDPNPIQVQDLGSNFFATHNDLGRLRDITLCSELRQMNDGVQVRTAYAGSEGKAAEPLDEQRRAKLMAQGGSKEVQLAQFPLSGTGALTEEIVRAHGVVLLTGSYCQDKDFLDKWGDFCHNENIGFVACNTFGATGFCFTDFGTKWETFDETGEPGLMRAVTGIFNSETIDDVIAEESAFVSKFEKEIADLGDIEDGDDSKRGKYNALMDQLQVQRMEVNKLTELKKMMKEDETIVVLDREQADLRIDTSNDNECFFQLEGVKGMEHKEVPGRTANNVGMWKVHKEVRFPKKSRTIQLKNPFTNESIPVEKDKNKTTLDPHLVRTSDSRNFGSYRGGGTLVQKKVPVRTDYMKYADAARKPNVLTCDYAKWGAAQQHHVAVQGMLKWSAKNNGELPTVTDFEGVKAAAADFLQTIDEDMRSSFSVDDAILKKTIMHSKSELHPLQAFFGGVAAQEVMKFTGKFLPLNQWMYLDCFELLEEELPEDCETKEASRYDHMIHMFGKGFADKVHESSTYLVGCGALGCEYAKNFAMLGLATKGTGHLHITDPDNIEVSNLARQFLFRKQHAEAKANKASTARGVIAKMNPEVNVTTYEKYAAASTEDLFNDTFYDNMTFVTNALDNVQARNYVDGRIVAARKPLLESGTQGTKCNSIVILPGLTQSYTDGAQISDEDGDAIPMCTLRNFPNLINHCVEWARSMFTDLFEAPFKTAKMYALDQKAYVQRLRSEATSTALKNIKVKEMKALMEILEFARDGPTFEKCLMLARDYMFRLHRDNILDLTHNFPEDAVKDGKPFWSKRRRFPQAANYDPNMEEQTRYIMCVANILAVNFGIQPEPDSTTPETLVAPGHEWRQKNTVVDVLQSAAQRTWTFSGEKAQANDDEEVDKAAETKENEEEICKSFDQLTEQLNTMEVQNLTFVEADFEKDLDANFHIDFMWSSTNLRAWNYQLELASRHKTKMIAGKIIPAILTATASICGLMAIEILKIIKGIDDLSKYKSSSCNLGVNVYSMMEPGEVVKNDGQAKAQSNLESAERSHKSCMERMQKKFDEGKLGDNDLQTIENVNSRKASAESALKQAQPCYPKGWTKWDKIVVEAETLSWIQLIGKIEKQSNYKVAGLYPISNCCTFFDAGT